MNNRDIIKQSIENKINDYMEIVETMYHNPEIGNEEFMAMKLLTDYLEKVGFKTQREYIVPTGFIAEYDTNKQGPTIAFLCEYDALPEIGHGCGHNLIAGIGIAAGEALKAVIDQYGGKVLVIGTPAEENFGGKVTMAQAGVFDNIDVALMVHPGMEHNLGQRSSALYPVKFEFYGKNAHAATPYEGKSALDAAVMSFVQINLMRQFVKSGTFIHGIISDGGTAANIIPAYASLEYYFRAPTIAYAKHMAQMAIDAATNIALANGTTMKHSIYECPYEDTVINYKLANMLKDTYTEIGLTDIQPVEEIPAGSTDVGAVSYKCPTIQGRIKIAESNVNGHSKELADATISSAGKTGLIKAAQGIALVALDLLENPDNLKEAKEEFDQTINNN